MEKYECSNVRLRSAVSSLWPLIVHSAGYESELFMEFRSWSSSEILIYRTRFLVPKIEIECKKNALLEASLKNFQAPKNQALKSPHAQAPCYSMYSYVKTCNFKIFAYDLKLYMLTNNWLNSSKIILLIVVFPNTKNCILFGNTFNTHLHSNWLHQVFVKPTETFIPVGWTVFKCMWNLDTPLLLLVPSCFWNLNTPFITIAHAHFILIPF